MFKFSLALSNFPSLFPSKRYGAVPRVTCVTCHKIYSVGNKSNSPLGQTFQTLYLFFVTFSDSLPLFVCPSDLTQPAGQKYNSASYVNGEFKDGVYGRRETAKMTSEFVFFSSNPELNHIEIEKCLLLFTTKTNIFTLLFKEVKTDGKSFIFAVCRLT